MKEQQHFCAEVRQALASVPRGPRSGTLVALRALERGGDVPADVRAAACGSAALLASRGGGELDRAVANAVAYATEGRWRLAHDDLRAALAIAASLPDATWWRP